MRSRKILFFIILVVIGYYNQTSLINAFQKIKGEAQQIIGKPVLTDTTKEQALQTDTPTALPELNNKPIPAEVENTPGPLQTFLNDTLNRNIPEESAVGIAGIISKTNAERASAGKKTLKENNTLDLTAYVKAKDMLDRQYFEHISPSGKGVGDLVTNVGYEYITVGENLALGNFASSSDIVNAWMNSPGHRANILNESYTEIGVGVISGTYEGRTVWIAVQHFGRPLSDCPATSTTLKNNILKQEKDTATMQIELDKQRTVISAKNASALPNYTQLVTEYNNLVKTYNALITDTKELITKYNKQILAFNTCISQK